jgi:hypothetical protein
MSQEGAPNRPANEPDRTWRRAIILIDCAFNVPDSANWQQKASDVNKEITAFANIYGRALEEAHDNLCSGALAAGNLNFLLADPKGFLQKYKIVVSGKPTSGTFEYGLSMGQGKYKLKPGDTLSTTKLRAINVPAIFYDSVKQSLDSITGTRSSDYDCSVMLTTQFTGCTYCFMISADGSSLVAAHIDPGGGVGRTTTNTGQSISQALRANGAFKNGNGGAFRAYGRVNDENLDFGYPMSADQMIITALKVNSHWRVYAQITEGTGWRVKRIDDVPDKKT